VINATAPDVRISLGASENGRVNLGDAGGGYRLTCFEHTDGIRAQGVTLRYRCGFHAGEAVDIEGKKLPQQHRFPAVSRDNLALTLDFCREVGSAGVRLAPQPLKVRDAGQKPSYGVALRLHFGSHFAAQRYARRVYVVQFVYPSK
jgi:hypothetical protein